MFRLIVIALATAGLYGFLWAFIWALHTTAFQIAGWGVSWCFFISALFCCFAWMKVRA